MPCDMERSELFCTSFDDKCLFRLLILFLKPLKATCIFIDLTGNIPPHTTNSHEGVNVVKEEPGLVFLLREHLHHILLHCAVVVAVPFFVVVIIAVIFELSVYIAFSLCGLSGVCLDQQLGTGLGKPLDEQPGIYSPFLAALAAHEMTISSLTFFVMLSL